MDIQNIIVGLIVLAAVIYVLRKFVFKKKTADGGSCSSCDKCGGGSGGCHRRLHRLLNKRPRATSLPGAVSLGVGVPAILRAHPDPGRGHGQNREENA